MMIQHIVLEPEHAQIRTGSTKGRIDLGYFGSRELLAQPVASLRSPAILAHCPGIRRHGLARVLARGARRK